MIIALLLIELIIPSALGTISLDLVALVDGLPDALADGLVGLVQLGATVAPFVVAAWLLYRRQVAQLLIVAGAAAVAAVLMALVGDIIDDSIPVAGLGYGQVNSWFIGTRYPSAALLAALTAIHVSLSPWLSRSWRVSGWLFLAALVIARTVSATEVPIRNGLLLAIGAFSGSLALVAFGAPRRKVDTRAVGETLRSVGVGVDHVVQDDDVDGDPTFVGIVDGNPLYRIKVLGRDQRDADLLLSAWRVLTVKGLGDAGAIRSPARAVQREALALGLFRAVGTRVGDLVAVAGTPNETAVLVVDRVPGESLDDLGADVSDAALHDLWDQIARLQERRLAHRRLAAQNLVVDGDQVSLVDLRRADLQATDEILGADVAELLVTTAIEVGTERAVAAAARLPTDQLARSVPLIQHAVFSRPTRDRLDALDENGERLLTELRDAAAERAGVDRVELTPIERITLGGVVSLVGSLVLLWYVFSLASDWDQIWDAFSSADLVYVIPILVMAASTYLTGALSMQGAVPIDLNFGRTTAVMFGQSYLNRFTPANAGGMAMRIRYLQLEGLDNTVAATSIGLTSIASGVAQVAMIVLFLMWGGASDRFSDFEYPDIGTIVVIILAVGLLVLAALASTWGRRVIVPRVTEMFGKVRSMLGEIAGNPRKLAQLFGGAVLGKLANIVAFWLSALAFDVDISFPKAGALYIIATTIGSAVPTPGGVGGVDAALTAALLSFGVDNATAAAVVLLFRILTFWLPTLPGYGFLRYAQRARIV